MSLARDTVASDPRFPETDDIPLETDWHRKQINFLCDLLDSRFHGRDDVFIAGNMFIYYDQDNPRKNAGPDVFFVKGANRWPRRRIWAVWKEQDRYPDVIIELMSPKTKNKDRKTNKALYESVFQTPEYFMYDPEFETLEGWRLVEGRYQPIEANAEGRMWSEQLGLFLGLCESDYTPGDADQWIRLFEPDGQLVPLFHERERERAEWEQQRAEQERQRAEQERQRAEQERQRAEQERQAAERERQRAEAAEAELARLRALLKQNEMGEPSDSDG
jgi:Uma2 family endonuclease